jgi:hypothetical protein
MGLDHLSLWGDYQDHVVHGWSLVESMLMFHIESLIRLELEKLPRSVQKALWWSTEKGRDAMFDATWGYEHDEPTESDLGNPTEEEMFEALIAFVLQQLSSKAEQEALESEIAKEADEEAEDDNDGEESDE